MERADLRGNMPELDPVNSAIALADHRPTSPELRLDGRPRLPNGLGVPSLLSPAGKDLDIFDDRDLTARSTRGSHDRRVVCCRYRNAGGSGLIKTKSLESTAGQWFLVDAESGPSAGARTSLAWSIK